MELIKPSFEIMAMTGHLSLPYQYQPDPALLIEAAGRNCYKSETKITKDSANAFMDGIKIKKHWLVMEHSWEVREFRADTHMFTVGNWNKYLYISEKSHRKTIVAGNLRAWRECGMGWASDSVPEGDARTLAIAYNEPFLMAATVRFINDRGVSHEQVRHRPPAICQESTRYVNYVKRAIQFVLPPWVNPDNFTIWSIFNKKRFADLLWLIACWGSEKIYCALIERGWSPQQARDVLINSLKTELVVTTNLQNWQHIFRQRVLGTTGAPHPQMKEAMLPVWESFRFKEPAFFTEEALLRL